MSLSSAQQHAGAPAIQVQGLGYAIGTTAIFDRLDLAIKHGAPTALLGPNGSGKTTLLRLMMGLTAPTAGTITLGRSSDARPLRRAFVFQKPVMLKRSVGANVAFALAAAGRPASFDQVLRLLDQVGLRAHAPRAARHLSAGEQQRLAFARALARAPDLLLLDEPTASLDPAQTKAVEDIIASAAAAGVKIVLATHDLGQARRLAADVVFLAHGRVVEHTPSARFFRQPSSEAAQRFLAGDLVL